MQKHSQKRSRVVLATAGALAIALGAVAMNARADVWNKKTIVTVNQPFQVENTYLEAGTYVFKLHDSNSNRHIVQIFNRDENRLIDTVMAIPNYRLQPEGNSRFTFYETPPGTARAMRAWFYPGDNFGQEFRYPKQLRQIATATTPVRAVEPAPEPVREPVQPSQPAVEPEPQASVQPPPPPAQPEPVQMAQNREPAPQPRTVEPARAPEPERLPKTATVFPVVGLGGLASLVGYGLLRFVQS